ncbi:MAG TPA: immune inhibitor A domain-containing protein, partial [Vicinamibacterales bacterium]|nr:immune inhibitor A domain-containing protein [Vicinamibacterales bacterium]
MAMKSLRSCSQHGPSGTYADGPTACAPHPRVISNIKKQIAKARILSPADARIAALSGMLGTPQENRTGFNDGVIYPPGTQNTTAGPALSGAKKMRVSRAHALAPGTQTLHCLVLLVDFSDNTGTKTAAHYESLLFDQTNPNSMASFYKELSYGQLHVTGTVVPWIRASKPYSHYANGASGTGPTYPKNTPGLLEEVLNTWTAAAGNSFAPFDVNGDGFV